MTDPILLARASWLAALSFAFVGAASSRGEGTARARQFDLYLRPPAQATAEAVDAPLPEPDAKGRLPIGFDRLSGFDYEPAPTEPAPAQRLDGIPESIRKLDGKRVVLRGFMLPLSSLDGRTATQFLILRSPSACCFGVMPRPNEWLVADASKRPQATRMDEPVDFTGTLRVGAKYERGAFAGIYGLEIE